MKTVNKFISRLSKIGVNVELIGNYPWVYLISINGVEVKDKYYSKYYFTAFLKGGEMFSDRRKVFKKVREML